MVTAFLPVKWITFFHLFLLALGQQEGHLEGKIPLLDNIVLLAELTAVVGINAERLRCLVRKV